MQQIQVETALGEKLAMQKGQVVLVDKQGRTLGTFSPMRQPTSLDDWKLEPPTSIEESEELRKRARVNPGRPLKDILKELGH